MIEIQKLLDTLHDATFNFFTLNWLLKEVSLSFTRGKQEVKVTFFGVNKFEGTYLAPWGLSKYVNDASLVQSTSEVTIVIEMQSGDNISLVFESQKHPKVQITNL
jgi:hypothetical protein